MKVNATVTIDESAIAKKAEARMQEAINEEYGHCVSSLLSDNKRWGVTLGPVRATIRKKVESLVLERMTEEKIDPEIEKRYAEAYAKYYQEALDEAIRNQARKQAFADVRKLKPSELAAHGKDA